MKIKIFMGHFNDVEREFNEFFRRENRKDFICIHNVPSKETNNVTLIVEYNE